LVEGRIVSVIGLAFGDCGKGLFTDYLCRAKSAHTVVRFNGGAQAGHNVVLPDGRHHTFSQFGAGTFNPGVATVLSAPIVVHPTALLVEEIYLQRAGVSDTLDRLFIEASATRWIACSSTHAALSPRPSTKRLAACVNARAAPLRTEAAA
jgi:adenylosuccinate synthase